MGADLVKKTVNLQKGTGPAVDLNEVRADRPDLAKRADKAGLALSKRDLTGMRAQGLLYLDHSGSTEFPERRFYSGGDMQAITERALGFTLQIDVDGIIPVRAFDNVLWREVKVGWKEDPRNDVHDYRDIVNRKIWDPSNMSGTRYSVVLEDVKREAKKTDVPLFVTIVTDGNPNDGNAATRLIRELAGYPAFIKFLAVEEVQYLRNADDMEGRLLDNVDSKFFNGQPDPDTGIVWPRIQQITDLQFADAMADEWDTWIKAATAAGILR